MVETCSSMSTQPVCPDCGQKKESLSYAFCNLTISKTISKFPRQLLKRWAFSLMKIKKGMYKCTCARGVCTLSMGDSFGFIMDFFCNKFLYHRVSCRKTNLYFCVLALEVCSHETFQSLYLQNVVQKLYIGEGRGSLCSTMQFFFSQFFF